MGNINLNSIEGRILLKRLAQERADKLEEIYRSADDKTAERLRGFVDALEWIVGLPNENDKQEDLIGDVYDCAE